MLGCRAVALPSTEQIVMNLRVIEPSVNNLYHSAGGKQCKAAERMNILMIFLVYHLNILTNKGLQTSHACFLKEVNC